MTITHIPAHLFWLFQDRDILKQGECYANAGAAVIFSSFENEISEWLVTNSWKISYTIGVLSPPGFDSVPHAWLKAEQGTGRSYWWDPTLQKNSRIWGMRSREFSYKEVATFNDQELKEWFKKAYEGSEFSPHGVPVQPCRFPIVDLKGNVS